MNVSEIVYNNPYRVLGVLAGTSKKELEKHRTKMMAFTRVGKMVHFYFDEICGLDIPKRGVDDISKATQILSSNENLIVHALYWFIEEDEDDILAFDFLSRGNIEEAKQFWENSPRLVALNNLSTLYLLSGEISDGIKLKAILLKSFSNSCDFFNLICRDAVIVDSKSIIKEFWRLIIVNNSLSEHKRFLVNTLKMANAKEQLDLVINRIIDIPLREIEVLIERFKMEGIKSSVCGLDLAEKLYDETKESLQFIQTIVGQDNVYYQSILDKLISSVLDLCLDSGKRKPFTIDQAQRVIELEKFACKRAIGLDLKNRCQKDIIDLEFYILSIDINSKMEVILKYIQSAGKINTSYISKKAIEIFYITNDYILSGNIHEKAKVKCISFCAKSMAMIFKAELLFIMEGNYDKRLSVKLITQDMLKSLNCFDDYQLCLDNLALDELNKAKNLISALAVKVDKDHRIFTPRCMVFLLILGVVIFWGITENCSSNKENKKDQSFLTKIENSSSQGGARKPNGPLNIDNQFKSEIPSPLDNGVPLIDYDSGDSNGKRNDDVSKEVFMPSKFVNNQLNTGDKPYVGVLGIDQLDENSPCYYTVYNSTDYDVIVSLKDEKKNKVIFHVYIQAHDQFVIKNIPTGRYSFNCFYGKGWNPERVVGIKKIKGAFEEIPQLSEDLYFRANKVIEFENDYGSYTYGNVTLNIKTASGRSAIGNGNSVDKIL